MNRHSIRRKRKLAAPGSKRIHKGAQVMVICGDDLGKLGTVLAVEGPKVLVQGINMVKKHVKRSQENPKGSTILFEKPVHVSNLRICVNDKPVKLKSRVNAEGNRELYFMEGDTAVVYNK